MKMDRKKFVVYAALVCVAMGAAVGYGVSVRNPLLPAISFAIGIVLIALGRMRVTEVMEDERIIRVSEKASMRVYHVFVTAAALIGTTLLALNRYTEVGYTLAFLACALLILYTIFYGYYHGRALD